MTRAMRFDASGMTDGAPEIRRLTFDLDVEVCVIGGGLAGLVTAIEAAQLGANVALLEQRRIGWGASGYHLGSVMPGFDVLPETIVARIGRRAASELWRMSLTGAEIVRAFAAPMPDVALSEGALKVATSGAGLRALDALSALGADFGLDGILWDRDRVRDALDSKHYFGAMHLERAFQIDAAAYLRGLVAKARQVGVRLFEDTTVVSLDISGTRKRVVTPSATLRASHVVLAGNTHLGAALPRLSKTLLPVWRYGAITEPLGALAQEAVKFAGTVIDTDAIDHYRLTGDRLMWSSPQTTWEAQPGRFARRIQRRIRTIFPALKDVRIAGTFGGAVGCTVHGMPQIGQLRPGLWVASGFGRQGLNTSAMAGRIIARGILHGDDRWRLFGPFDLIWAGGRAGQVAGHAIEWAGRQHAAAASAWARREEASAIQSRRREARIAAVSQRAAREAAPVAAVTVIDPPDEPLMKEPVAPETVTAKPAIIALNETAQKDVPPAELNAISLPVRDPLPPSPFLDALEHVPSAMASRESEHQKPPAA